MTISSFKGAYAFLSNFYPAPVLLPHVGVRYPTSEHAYQALKAVTRVEHDRVAEQPTPGLAKRTGRKITCRGDWEQVKDATMLMIVRAKFAPGTLVAELLRATGDEELVEGNTWGDRYWGVCDGVGLNRLGRILMQVRAENSA